MCNRDWCHTFHIASLRFDLNFLFWITIFVERWIYSWQRRRRRRQKKKKRKIKMMTFWMHDHYDRLINNNTKLVLYIQICKLEFWSHNLFNRLNVKLDKMQSWHSLRLLILLNYLIFYKPSKSTTQWTNWNGRPGSVWATWSHNKTRRAHGSGNKCYLYPE